MSDKARFASRRRVLRLAAGVAVAPSLALWRGVSDAATYPDGPVKLVIPYSAGGSTDVAGRLVAGEMSSLLGQPFIVDNRPGASGGIAMEYLAKARPDGYTIGIGNIGQLAVLPAVKSVIPFDPLRDFAVIGGICIIELILVARTGLPFDDLPRMIAYAKANPGKVSFAAAGGLGASPHLAMEYFKKLAGVNITTVPYKGEAPAINDMLGNHVDLCLASTSVALQHVKSGKLKALAATSPARSKLLPDVKLATESGIPFEAYSWSALIAPAATPQAILERLNGALNVALKKPQIADALTSQGIIPMGGTAAAGKDFVRAEFEKWGKVARENNITAEE